MAVGRGLFRAAVEGVAGRVRVGGRRAELPLAPPPSLGWDAIVFWGVRRMGRNWEELGLECRVVVVAVVVVEVMEAEELLW